MVPKATLTTLTAQEFHVKIILVNIELVNNVFLWKYHLTGHSHMAKREGSFNHFYTSPCRLNRNLSWSVLERCVLQT